MKILVLGGTLFVGRGIIDYALKQGHEITMFNRGKTDPNAYSQIEHLVGDRDGNLDALKGRKWDAVIDTCGYLPRIVRQSADLLKDSVDLYCFISTLSVFPERHIEGIDENGTLATIKDESVEEINGETYGPYKVICENEIMERYPDNFCIVRPGIVVGPYDPTDRFTRFAVETANCGEVIGPGNPDQHIQYIDYRDLGAFTVRLVENQTTGLFNTCGPHPDHPTSMKTYLETAKKVSGSNAEIIWMDEEFLIENGVQPFVDIPFWNPQSNEQFKGMFKFNNRKAVANGLTFTPLEKTLKDTIEWAASFPEDYEWKAGMKADKQTKLIKIWKEKQNQ